MKKEPGDIEVSSQATSTALSVSNRRLRQLAAEGKIHKIRDGVYSMYSIIRYALGKSGRDADEVGEILDKDQEQARLTRIKADREELKLLQDRKQLLPADEVKAGWAATLIVIKQRCRHLAQKLRQELSYLTDEIKIEELLQSEIDDVLLVTSQEQVVGVKDDD